MTARGFAWISQAIALLSGCGPAGWQLELAASTQSVVLVEQASTVAVEAFDLRTNNGLVQLKSSDLFGDLRNYRLVLLEYDATLEALRLRAGPVVLAPQTGSPLPAWDRAWLAASGDAGFHPDEPGGAVRELKVELAGSPDDCRAAGNCYGEQDLTCGACSIEPSAPVVAQPAPPHLTPCPAGWAERADDVSLGTWCEPWPGQTPADCAADEVIFPGEPACHPLSEPCARPFAPGLPAGTLYVDASAPPGGTGTLAQPFDSLGTALQAVPMRGTIALAAGRYTGAIQVGGGVALVGACTAGTRLVAGSGDAAVRLTDTATLSRLTVEGGAQGVIAEAGVLNLDRVAFTGAAEFSIVVAAPGRGRFREVAVRGGTSVGLVTVNATVAATRLSLVDLGHAGIQTSESTLRLSQLSIFGIHRLAAEADAMGVVGNGGSFSLTEAVVERAVSGGIIAGNRQQLTARTLVVRDIQVGGTNVGALSLDQARADIAQVYLARSPVFGLGLGHRAVIHSEDLIIDDPQALQGDHASGILTDSGRGTLARLRVRTSGDGINLRATTGAMNATISDALVSGKATPNESDYRRSGLECFGADARCRFERALVEHFSNGLRAENQAQASGADLRLRLLRAAATFDVGARGVVGNDGAAILLERVIVERAPAAAAELSGPGTRLVAVDVLFGDALPCSEPDCAELASGAGIRMFPFTALHLRRFTIQHLSLQGLDPGASGDVDIADGVFADAPVGVLVPPGFDLSKLLHRVRYLRNGEDWKR
ncbi:MAG: hypothetical protein U1E65_28570 [Myxococcota bacterium]